MKKFLSYSLLFCILLSSCKQDGVSTVKPGAETASVITIAGSTAGYADGQGTDAKFFGPHGIAIDIGGTLYVADLYNNKIRKVTSAGAVTTLAGSTDGFVNGTGTNAKFSSPEGVAVDIAGNVYVADTGNSSIRKISSVGVVTTLAGNGQGYVDGQGSAARFSFPVGIAIDASGSLYVADTENYRIRKVTSSGLVSTLAGSGTPGLTDGSGTSAQFSNPTGLVVDANGTIYVADDSRIRKITAAGVVTTLAGSTAGYVDGKGSAARFTGVYGVAVDTNGNVYVSDTDNSRIRKITVDGTVTTLAGGTTGYVDGSGTLAQFNNPMGMVMTGFRLYIVEDPNNRIRMLTVQ